jgi:beta-lactamase superfamily II metal-dependent hydrolase
VHANSWYLGGVKVTIHDVGHGACAVVRAPNGARLMIDCGLRYDPQAPAEAWFPSVHYSGEHFEALIIQNLDEDHVEDLLYLLQQVTFDSVVSNSTISAAALARMKAQHGMGDGVRSAYRLLSRSGSGFIGAWPPDTGALEVSFFRNRFGRDYVDTNNLSLAVFLSYGAFSILFAGDLESAGWRTLLEDDSFVSALSSVDLMVASHHGRRSGCCEDAFEVCRPDAVIFSDSARQFDTQQTDAWYRARTRGIPSARQGVRSPATRRHVLTTRRDGTLAIEARFDGGYRIQTHAEPLLLR